MAHGTRGEKALQPMRYRGGSATFLPDFHAWVAPLNRMQPYLLLCACPQQKKREVMMKKFSLLGMAVVLAGCGGASTSTNSGSTALTKAQLAALPNTATMPTGTANYAGKYQSIITVGGAVTTNNADWSMAANFNANTVTGVLSNVTERVVAGGNTRLTTTSGTVNAAGTITGNSFTAPAGQTGTLTVTGATLNNVATAQGTISGVATNVGATATLTTLATTANFKGTNAEGIYGTGAVPNGTYELYGNKQ